MSALHNFCWTYWPISAVDTGFAMGEHGKCVERETIWGSGSRAPSRVQAGATETIWQGR